MTTKNINNNDLINITIWIDKVPIVYNEETDSYDVNENIINQRIDNLSKCMHKYVYTNETINYNNNTYYLWKYTNISSDKNNPNTYLLTNFIDYDILDNEIANKENNWNITENNINKPFNVFIAFLNKDKNEIYNNLNCSKPYRIFFVEGKITNTIIRHYKIVSTKPNIQEHDIDKEINDNNIVTSHIYNIKRLSHNIDYEDSNIINYVDPIKTEDSIFESNIYNDYESFNDSLQSFSDKLNLDDHTFKNDNERDDFINSIRSTLYNNGETQEYPIYIRFAPKNEEKQDLIIRILSIKGLYNSIVGEGGYLQKLKQETEGSEEYQKIYNEIEHFLEKIDNSDIPIYNDDRYYSLEKYNIVKELFEEKLQQEIE